MDLRDSTSRALRVFADVRPDELGRALLLQLNLVAVLVAYYVLKTVREPLVLTTGGADAKSYASGVQALLLLALVPLYARLVARVPRERLARRVVFFFLVCIETFALLVQLDVPFTGIAFFVWVGIFSLSAIAQVWSIANDAFSREAGERVFPFVALGASVGSVGGAWLAARLFDAGLGVVGLLHVAAGVLLVHALSLPRVLRSVGPSGPTAGESRSGGFARVLASPYLRGLAGVLVLLNLVNTVGEYVLSAEALRAAEEAFAASPGQTRDAFVDRFLGTFYGEFFLGVNVAGVALQAFVVSRLVRVGGFSLTLLALPLVSLGVWASMAAGVGLGILVWAKTAENATDYSVMSTAKGMAWLPTSRLDKYAAKQAIDTFFVRAGDVLAAGVVFVGQSLAWSTEGFASLNVVLVLAWIGMAFFVAGRYRAMARAGSPGVAGDSSRAAVEPVA